MAKNDHNAYLTALQTNKNPYVNSVGNAAKGVVTGVASSVASLNTAQSGSVVNGFGRIAAYVIGIIIIIIVLSLLVHYFVTPIYSAHPGDPGIIPIPWADNGQIFWNNTGTYPIAGTIKNADLPISNAYMNYSLTVDMFIQNPMQFSSRHRILLSRGATMNATPSGTEMTGLSSNYNLIIALAPSTTDLIISVLNTNNQSENSIIDNVPVQKAFRLGIIIMEKAMEIYINGLLIKTKKFDKNTSLMDVKGDIMIASGAERNIAKMQNLTIWNTVLTSPEIAHAKPAMATDASFAAGAIPSSTSCATR
jgi:hypothetical protein